MKKERDPTPEEFERFLQWISFEKDAAGQKLNTIHSRLTKILISRGCIDAETLADEVVNRVAVRIENVTTAYSDPLQCFFGFLENVHREYVRERIRQTTAQVPPSPRSSEVLEKEDKCLTTCLSTLPKKDCDLFLRYFRVERKEKIRARKALAEELKLTANALRIQGHRLRRRMFTCLQSCLDQN